MVPFFGIIVSDVIGELSNATIRYSYKNVCVVFRKELWYIIKQYLEARKCGAFNPKEQKEKQEKLQRKFRRTYELCNKRLEENQKLKEQIVELKEKNSMN